jgi:GNAT superfamily N-acetyltransferase/fermentation-respiration switch protein FrsA (DUF1100 family)
MEPPEITILGPDTPTAAVLFAVGGGGDPRRHLPLLEALAGAGFRVIAPHFARLTDPWPTEEHLRQRATVLREAALQHGAKLPLVGIGHSIGATMLLALAGGDLWLRPSPGEKPAPLVLPQLPFARLLLLAPPTGYFPQPFSANAPVSVWVGANDTVTPPAQAERLAELLVSPADVHVVPGADHFSFLHVAPPVPRQESAELAPGFLAEMTATLVACAEFAARHAQHPRIRLATDADIPALQAVGIAADRRFLAVGLPEYADGTTIPTDAAQRAIARGDLWVAERSGVVGWILLGRVGGECCIGQVSVDPAFGRAGIGTALLRHALAVARRRGEGSVVLFTEANVPWNGPWYEREGFRRIPEDAVSGPLGSGPAVSRDAAGRERTGPIASVLAAQRADLPAEKRAQRIALRWVAV